MNSVFLTRDGRIKRPRQECWSREVCERGNSFRIFPFDLGRFSFLVTRAYLPHAARHFLYHGDADVGVDTEPGSWEAASEPRACASAAPREMFNKLSAKIANKRKQQSGLIKSHTLVPMSQEWEFTRSSFKLIAWPYTSAITLRSWLFRDNVLIVAREQRLVRLPHPALIGSNPAPRQTRSCYPPNRETVQLTRTKSWSPVV